MKAKPKPLKKIKTVTEKIAASQYCKRHQCLKRDCYPHRPSQAKPRKPLQQKTRIRTKPKKERRVFTASERTRLESELDRLCSIFVRRRDGRCVTCGTTQNLTCSHFVKRQYQEVRYDVRVNLNCQCARCNEAHNSDETAYEGYIAREHGLPALHNLRKAKVNGTSFSWSVVELREKLDIMRGLVSNIQ